MRDQWYVIRKNDRQSSRSNCEAHFGPLQYSVGGKSKRKEGKTTKWYQPNYEQINLWVEVYNFEFQDMNAATKEIYHAKQT